MGVVVDKILDDILMHDHSEADLGAILDSRYFIASLRSTILASTPSSNKIGYATDTGEFFLYTNGSWRVAPLELSAQTTTPDMGAYSDATTYLGVSDKQGYYSTAITDKSLSNVRILGNENSTAGSIRTTTTGYFQIYLNSTWNNVVINFVLREDSSGGYQMEHAPVGFNWYYELMSGNSDNLGMDGKPILQQYGSSMGAFQVDLQVDGGSF